MFSYHLQNYRSPVKVSAVEVSPGLASVRNKDGTFNIMNKVTLYNNYTVHSAVLVLSKLLKLDRILLL